MTTAAVTDRSALVRRGLLLNYLTIGYNLVEAVVSVAAGLVSGSVALVTFGVDSGIEVTSSLAANWRLRADLDPERRERAERLTHRIIGWCFLALAAYVVVESVTTLWQREAPQASPVGLVVLILSVLVMPLIARASRKVARALGSRALEADAAQTSLCAYLSVIALAGVGLNAALGWWWADPVAALGMVPIIAKEGLEGVGGENACDCHPGGRGVCVTGSRGYDPPGCAAPSSQALAGGLRMYYVRVTTAGEAAMARKKSRKAGSQDSVATGSKSPVTLRLGELEPAVEERASGSPLGSIVRRDLARYYRLIGDYHLSLLGVDEADVVAHALRKFDEAAYQYVWAAVDDFLASRDSVMEGLKGLPIRERFWRVNREILTQLLRGRAKDRGWSMALLDAVERYWSRLQVIDVEPFTGWIGLPEGYDPEYPVSDAEIDAFVDVGLVGPEAAERYRYKRDDPARSKTLPEPEPIADHRQDVEAQELKPVRSVAPRDQV